MALDPLQCPACAAPVPLVAGDHGACPSCGGSYPIPGTYQALRDAANADARKPEGLALAKALGKPPPLAIRMFAVFSSAWFVMIGLGFWLAAGMAASAAAMPWIGRHVFRVNTYDVLTAARQMQFMVLLPLGTLVIGFTLSSWARKRGIVRGGLQAALAATPPARAGGPKNCHRCAAPLAPEPGALTARCAYCQADNLVEMPAAWVEQMRAQARTLVKEVDAATRVWTEERRALRRGLLIRFIAWSLAFLALWFIFGGVASNSEEFPDLSYEHAANPPTDLPAWHDEVSHGRVVDLFKCDGDDGYQYMPSCANGRCAIYVLVALRHDEVIRHHSTDLPAGSVIDLQMHDQSWLSDGWLTVASAPVSAGTDAITRVPYSGWYRFRVTVPKRAPYTYCTTLQR